MDSSNPPEIINQSPRPLTWKHGVVIIIALLGTILSLAVFAWTYYLGERAAQEEFEGRASMMAGALTRTTYMALETVLALRGLFDASVQVERSEFHAFTEYALSRHPEIRALEWIPRVPNSERRAYEQAAQADGLYGFAIKEQDDRGQLVAAQDRPEYYPVFYVEPFEGNEIILGYDLASEPDRRKALEQARDSGEPTVTAPIRIVQEPTSQLGFLFFVPVYQKGRPLTSVQDRRQYLQGFALGVFQVEELVAALFKEGQKETLALRIYDVTEPDQPTLMYGIEPETRLKTGGRSSQRLWFLPEFQWETTLNVGKRQWLLALQPISGYNRATPWLPWLVLAIGLLLTVVAGSYGLHLVNQAARVRRLVNERTAELTELNWRLKESEERTRAVLMSISEGLTVLDLDGRIRWWNPALESFTGLSASQTLEKQVEDLLKLKNLDPGTIDFLGAVNAALTSGDKGPQSFYVELTGPKKLDLSSRKFAISTEPEKAMTGIIVRDVTKEREAERRREEFVSIASHELRTPMTTVLGFTQLLLTREVPETTRRQWLQYIYEDVLRLVSIVDDLLSVSRIRVGKASLNSTYVSLQEVTRDVLDRIKATTTLHTFVADIPENIPQVWCDREKLIQIFVNLLSNAIKYSPKGGQITVSARSDQEQRRVVISVEDQGIGIAPHDMEQLFTSFHRISRPETESVRGTGLGLYITKSLVELMNGTIWVESQLGKGSAFRVTMPTWMTS